MDIGKQYGYDKELGQGKWFIVNGIKVKLAYMNSPNVEIAVKKMKDELLYSSGGSLTSADHEKIGTDAFKKHILKDWDSELTIDGEPLPFTEENVDIVMNRFPKFILDCIQKSNDNKQFQDDKNSETVGK